MKWRPTTACSGLASLAANAQGWTAPGNRGPNGSRAHRYAGAYKDVRPSNGRTARREAPSDRGNTTAFR